MMNTLGARCMTCLRIIYVVFAFCAALSFGALKGLAVGPIAALLLITGNVSVILGLFPVHIAWTAYSVVKTRHFVFALKIVLLAALPVAASLWLAISIIGSFLVGVGYGFFTPWVATFEAFRQETESSRFIHCITDGTWSTIKGSCTVVRDFLDMCYHSYNSYLQDFREKDSDHCDMNLREVPACIVVGLMGLIVDVPLFTVIAISKSPYMLLRGWQRLLHDLISREGPFFEAACVPVAGIVILLWPLAVIGSALLAIFSGFFFGLYGAVIVYQESSFWRGMAYLVAVVAEFDEYTNDLLYLREGSCFPRPNYRKKRVAKGVETSTKLGHASQVAINAQFFQRASSSSEHGRIPTSLTASRSVREVIQEVKMVQVWQNTMTNCELRGKELVHMNVITAADFEEWIRSSTNGKSTIVDVGIPSYSLLFGLLHSIRAGTVGLLMADGIEMTHLNRPQDRILDWFFNPIILLRDQIKAANMSESELRFLEKLTLMSGDMERMKMWENGAIAPDNAMRNAEIQAISRRLQGLTRSISRFPTYRRRYQQVVKALLLYAQEIEVGPKAQMLKTSSGSTRSSRKEGFLFKIGSSSRRSSRNEGSSQHSTSIDIIPGV